MAIPCDTTDQETILVVDDTVDNLRILSKILESEGYDVRKARSGKMAIQGMQHYLPHLILLDINMPDLNGYEVCKTLKSTSCTAQIPIIFVSAFNQPEDKCQAFTLGGADYITKPFLSQEVLMRVQTQLLIRRQQRQLEYQRQLLQTTTQAFD